MRIKVFLDNYRRPLIVLTHLLLIIIAYLLSFYLRFEFIISKESLSLILKTLPLLVLIKMGLFYYFGLFSGLWRYASTDDLWRILKATSISNLVFIVCLIFVSGSERYPRSIFILDWILCTSFVSGVRLLSRLFKEAFKAPLGKRRKKVLIVGAGEAGVIVLREYRNNPSIEASIAGFIDDDPTKLNLRIQGIKILGNRQTIADIVDRYLVDEIVIAIPSAKGEDIRKILSYCQIPNVKVKIVPGLHKIINGDLEVKPRDVKPEDLLGRETVKIDEKEIAFYIKNKRILVTGAGGSIGSELCRQMVHFGPEEIILYDHNENDVYFLSVEFKTKYPEIRFKTIIGDIKDVGLLKYVFSHYKPHIVFHSAAHKHVPLMEENIAAAVKNNIIGSRNLIYAAHHYKVERFILISTDKAVNPTSVMGATKRIAEMILQAKAKTSKTKFMAVRFGNVIGSDGSVVPLFKKQIEEGGPVTVTHSEAKRYFMSVNEAAQLVLQTGAMGKGGEIFILDMGEQIKIIDLARNLIALSGLEPEKDISIEFTGLRAGEKLSEETLLDTENEKATEHEKILITQPNDFNLTSLRKEIRELERLTDTMREDEIIAKMRQIIPEYKPND
jgi:FlaA1/EpsC-like NDP-sugar epimerase